MFARPAVRKVTFFRVLKKRDAPVNINRVCFVENLTAEPKLTTHRKAPPLLSSSFLHSSERQILGRPSVSFSIQIESISMSYFLSITGSQTKFSKSGFLLRTTGSILEQRAIELRAIHAVDLPVAEIANRDLTAQFIANTTDPGAGRQRTGESMSSTTWLSSQPARIPWEPGGHRRKRRHRDFQS
jgi:hypothetical protein